MTSTIKHQRICLVVNFTPKFPEGEMPREIDQDELRHQLWEALGDRFHEADFKIFGSRGGHFEKVPEGHTFEEAVESFDRHIIELLFGERLQKMAETPQGQLALLMVVQNARQAQDDAAGAILTEVDEDQLTKQ